MRESAAVMDAVAAEEGWPVPFSPTRLLILSHLEAASRFGLTPARLARLLQTRPSSLAHHLDVLEREGLITRRPRDIHDRREVAVRATRSGVFAARRMESALSRAESRRRARAALAARRPEG